MSFSKQPISIRPVFDFDRVEYNKASEVCLDVILEAPEQEDQKRVPLHMVLAIDCSGSMYGSKLESVKTTVLKMINHLTENDTLGILGFSSSVWEVIPVLPMTQENKTTAVSKVRGLLPMSMTNMEQAMIQSIERAATADKRKICRIVLLTDGLPTCGDCNQENLVNLTGKMGSQISMTCFGYGSDYDPELLTSISNRGRGNNFYIQNDDDCNKAFAMELGGLLSLYAQDIKISISPSGNMTLGDFLSSYQVSKDKGYRGLTDGRMEFTIDDIYEGEKKHSILKIKIPKASEAVCVRETRVCDITIDYLDVETKKRVEASATARIQYVKPGDSSKEENEEVKRQLMMVEAARIQAEAQAKADAGDYKAAQVVLDEGITWARNNSWFDNSAALVCNFESLYQNTADAYSYNMAGKKMSHSFSRSLCSNRASSSTSSPISYTSKRMKIVMDSFEQKDEEGKE